MGDQGEPAHKHVYLHWKLCLDPQTTMNNIHVSITLQAKHPQGGEECNMHFFFGEIDIFIVYIRVSELEFSYYFMIVITLSVHYEAPLNEKLLCERCWVYKDERHGHFCWEIPRLVCNNK